MDGSKEPKRNKVSTKARVWIGVLPLLLVALQLLIDTERMSPGPLTAVHAREQEWSLAEDCSACHGGWFQSMAGACLDCHEDIEQRIDTARGVHGLLDEDLLSRCSRCHSEHQGPSFRMVSGTAFVLAGVGDVDAYDHAGLDFGLNGAHDDLRCDACHPRAFVDILPLHTKRFVGLDQDCTSCHEDRHEGKYGDDCSTCHGQQRPFAEMAGLTHDEFCPLDGAHGRFACADCHAEGTRWAVSVLVEQHIHPGPGDPPNRTCADCHRTPHGREFLRQVARRTAGPGVGEPDTAMAAEPADGTVCARCHSAVHESFAGFHPEMDLDLHTASGFPLENAHRAVPCGSCHAGLEDAPADPSVLVDEEPRALVLRNGVPSRLRAEAVWPHFTERFPGREPDACDVCHGNPHGGEFERGPFSQGGCLGCHGRNAFAPNIFTVDQHARTSFALLGSHAQVECQSCHRVPDGTSRKTEDGSITLAFQGTPTSCDECHRSPHRVEWMGEIARRFGASGGERCEVCHRAEHATFVGESPRMDPELHALCGFGLDDPHDAVACKDCHPGFGSDKVAWSTEVPDPARWPERTVSSWSAKLGDEPVATVPQAFPGASSVSYRKAYPGRPPDRCQECHVDPHEGQFELGPFGEEGCLACHDHHAFFPPAFGMGEHVRTGFPLDGAHAAVGCVACHPAPEGSAEGSALRHAGTESACHACHEDPHSGLFDEPGAPSEVEGKTGCARCHDTESFAAYPSERFDHKLWTGFELEGAHADSECQACHVPLRRPDAVGRTFGATRGNRCTDCHLSPHVGQFAVDGVTDCKRCHTSGGGFSNLNFDHQRDSRFGLDEDHIRLECGACHRNTPLAAGAWAIRYKPLGVECGDCHDTLIRAVRLDSWRGKR